MANEVAALGLKVDPSGITEGIKALDDLAARGPKAEKAMDAVGESAAKASKSLKTLGQGSAKGLEDVGQAAPKAAESVGRLSKSAENANSSLSKISSSATGLTNVATASAQSAKSVESLSASLAQTQKTLAQMQMQLQTASAATANLGKAQSDAARNATGVAAAYKSAGERVSAYARAPEQAAVANQRLSKSMEATASAARLISSAFAISGIGLGASQIIALSDGYTKFTAQLKLATKSASDYAVAMEDVQRIAYGAQAGISEVGTLYARIANGTAELGLSQQRLADITEVVALSLKVSGATAAESSSAMLQLSQAFASGVLRGEEFNAVNESAPRLMKALAEGIGVPIGALRKMAEEGQLTSKVLAEALPKALAQVRSEAEKIQTIGGAFTNLNSKMMEFVGGAGEASGAAKAIANSVLLVADNLGVVTTAFGAAALVMSGRYVGALTAAAAAKRAAAVAAEATAIATTAASRAALAGSTSFQAMGASATTATFGVTAMAGATRAAGAALAFFGGPIGLAITALGVAASAFLYLRDSSEEAIKSIGGLNQPLDDLKKKLDELPPEKRISVLIDVEKSGKEAVRDAQKSIEDLTNFVRVFGNYTLPAEEVRKYTDELQKTAAAGGDLTPVLKRAAEAGQVPQKVLQRWLDLAANIREARSAAANADAALAAAGTNVGGGRGTINPPTIAEMNASARAEAQSVLQATTAYKSKAEQIAELRGQEEKLRAALNGLISTNQGASKSADDLRLRLSGVADRMAGLQKSTSAGSGAIKDTENAYKSLSNRVAEYIAQLQQEVAQGGKVTNSQKMQIQLDELLASSKSKVSKAALQALQNSIKTAAGLEQEAAAAENAAKAYEEGLKWKAEWYAAQGKNLEEIKSANNRIREEIQLIGLSQDAQQALERARIEATLTVREQHLAEMQRANDANQFSSIEQQNLEMEIALLKERLGLLDDKRVRTANVEAAKELENQWNKTSQTIGDTLADYIMGGGKDAATYLKRLFSNLVLQPVVQTVVGGILGGGGAGGAGGGVSGLPNQLANSGGGFTNWSSWGATSSDWLMTQSTKLGLNGMQGLGDAAYNLGNTIQGVDNWLKEIPGMDGGLGSAFGYAQAIYSLTQGNYGSAIGSAIGTYILPGIGTMIGSTLGSLVDGMFGGGTPHVGAAARYSGGGLSDYGAGYTSRTGLTRTYGKAMQAPIDSIVKTIGSSLDSISELFGGKRGFSVSAGFASDNDDTSAALLKIFDPDNNQVVRWTAERFDSLEYRRTSRFSSDPKEGFDQYLKAVTADAIPVFKELVPKWADDLLDNLTDSLGVTKAIESGDPYAWQKITTGGQEAFQALQTTLAQIAQIDAAFDALGKTMVVFADMTDEMKTALLGGLGGIEGFSAAAQTYYAAYYSEQERYTEALARMQEVLAGIGVEIDPAMGSEAKAQYRALVESAFADGNEELATQLLALSGAFAQTADAAQEVTNATQEQVQALTQGAIDLLSRLPGGAADARDMQAQMLAQQASAIWGGTDVAALQSTILSVNAQEVEAYLREAWAAADTVGAKQAVVDFGLAMMDFIGDAQSAEEALDSLSDVMRGLLNERKQLEAEMLRASGDDAGYAKALRAIATEGYTEAEIAAWDYNQALRAQVQAQEDAARQQIATARQVVDAQRQLAMDAAAAVREQISAVQSRIKELESEADWVRTQAGMGYGQAGVGAADKFTASLYSGYEGYAANMAALAQQYDGMTQAQKDMLAELESEESRHKGTVQRLESILSEEKAQVTQLMSLETAIGVLQGAVVGAIEAQEKALLPAPAAKPPAAKPPAANTQTGDPVKDSYQGVIDLLVSQRGNAVAALAGDEVAVTNFFNAMHAAGITMFDDVAKHSIEIYDKEIERLQGVVAGMRTIVPTTATAATGDTPRVVYEDGWRGLELRRQIIGHDEWWSRELLKGGAAISGSEANLAAKAIIAEIEDAVRGMTDQDAVDKIALAIMTGQKQDEEQSGSAASGGLVPDMTIADYQQLAQLQQQYWQLLGDEESIRAAVLDTMHPQLRVLQQQVWAQEDQNRITQERSGLEQQLLQLQGDTAALRKLELDALDPSNRALQQRLSALEEEQRVAQERSGLEQQLLQLQGDTAALRKIELDALDPSNRALQQRLWALEEEQRITQERSGLEQQLLQLQGDTAALRKLELDALDPSNRALQQMIWSIGDLQDAAQTAAQSLSTAWASVGTASGWAAEYLGDGSGLESMLATVRESYAGAQTVQQREAALGQIINLEQQLFNLEQKRQEGAIEAAQKAADAASEQLEAVSKTLQAAQALGDYAQKMMYGEQSGLSDADRFAALGAEYASLLARAQSGDAEAMQELSGVTSDYLGLAQELAVSQADYSVLSGRIAAELSATAVVQEASAKTQEDMLQAQIDSAQEQIKALQKQFDVSNETKALIDQQLTDAQAQFEDQQAKVQELIDQGADTNLLLGALPGELGGMILPAINAATAAAQAAGAIAAAAQSAAAAAAASAAAAAASSAGIPTPADLLTPLPRPERVLPTPIKAFASGGLHTGGLRLVGERGPELEVTGPARYFDASKTSAMLSGGRDAELVAEIRALREQNARLEERLQGIERSSQQLADQFDNVTVGGNAMAVEVMA